jgi:hypothetical protein
MNLNYKNKIHQATLQQTQQQTAAQLISEISTVLTKQFDSGVINYAQLIKIKDLAKNSNRLKDVLNFL